MYILLLKFCLFFICMYLCLCIYVYHMNAGVWGGQRALDPQELELQMVVSHLMWMSVIKLRASSGSVRALRRWAIAPVFTLSLYMACKYFPCTIGCLLHFFNDAPRYAKVSNFDVQFIPLWLLPVLFPSRTKGNFSIMSQPLCFLKSYAFSSYMEVFDASWELLNMFCVSSSILLHVDSWFGPQCLLRSILDTFNAYNIYIWFLL